MKRVVLVIAILALAAACATPRPPDLSGERAQGRRHMAAVKVGNLRWKAWQIAVRKRDRDRAVRHAARARYARYLAAAKALSARAAAKPRVYSVYVPTHRVAPPAVPVRVESSSSCGGDLPPCYVLQRESGGNPRAENPTSTASGLWQFIDSTWANYGGYRHASDAPVSVQNARARQLWDHGAGASHWAVR